MNVTELIGFVASLLAMLFFMGKQIYENRSNSKNHKNKSNDSNRTRTEREERLRKFLGSLSDDMKEASSLPSSDRNRQNAVVEEDDEDEDYEEEGYDEEDEEEESRQSERDKQLMIAKELHRSEINAFQSKHQPSIKNLEQSHSDSYKRRLLSDDFTYHANMDKFSQQTNIESRRLSTSIENRYYGEMHGDNLVSEELRVAQSDQSAQHAYDIVSRHEISRAKRILRNLSSPRDMVICAEIFGKPKAFEN